MLVVVALFAVAGLACTPKGNPVGVVDLIRTDAAGRVVADGWAFDPETPGTVAIELREGTKVLASGRTGSPLRPDVAAAYPGQATSAAGFSLATPVLSPGLHTVCVWAKNKGIGTGDTRLGCIDVGLDSFSLVGDSLGVGVESSLRTRIANAWPGSSLTSRVQAGSSLSYAVTGINQFKGTADVIVVSSGANNLLSSTIAADLRTALGATVGARCVVWPTVSERIYGDPTAPPTTGTAAQWKAGAQTFNATLRAEAAARANLHVADWAPVVTATASYTGTDGLHHTASGTTAFATLITQTIAANC